MKAKLKATNYPNRRATHAWYTWMKRTNRMCLPGDGILEHLLLSKNLI